MVSEQLAQAMDTAKQIAGGAVPAPGKRAAVPAGGRVMVAMMNAAGNRCPCTPCRLLRAESATMAELALADLDENGSVDTEPATGSIA